MTIFDFLVRTEDDVSPPWFIHTNPEDGGMAVSRATARSIFPSNIERILASINGSKVGEVRETGDMEMNPFLKQLVNPPHASNTVEAFTLEHIVMDFVKLDRMVKARWTYRISDAYGDKPSVIVIRNI